MAVSQVAPNPFRGISPSPYQYRAALAAGQTPRHCLTYQGYWLGRTFLDALQRVIAFHRMVLGYTGGGRLAANCTDMSMLRPDGRFAS